MQRSHLVVLLLLCFCYFTVATGCQEKCQSGSDICCNGKLINSGRRCSCSNNALLASQIVATGGNSASKFKFLEEEEAAMTLADEMTLSDLPVCTLNCKQVCSDCANDASIVHTLTTEHDANLCVTQRHFTGFGNNLKKQIVQEVRAHCSRVCTKCYVLSNEAAEVLGL